MKLALGIEYDGSAYYGWQRQQKLPSIQAYVEYALSTVADEPITVFCAGRTDAGVHATGQVVHFETNSNRSDTAWTLGVNANLPKDIAVRWVASVNNDFHARFDATARRYRYMIYNHQLRPALFANGLTYYHQSLDVQKMERAGQCLIGENDFTSFCSLQCQPSSPWRNLYHLLITRHSQYITVDIKANSFVYHMVRNIVGSLIEVGCGKRSESWIAELLTKRDRTLAAATAPAKGLYLVAIDYPSQFILPSLPLGPFFLIK